MTKIILNNTLEPEFLPPELPFRTNEMKSLAANYKFYFEPKIVMKNLQSNQNLNTMLLILGGPGQGKTSLVKLTINEIVELASQNHVNIISSYQNCWKSYSAKDYNRLYLTIILSALSSSAFKNLNQQLWLQ